MSTADPAPRSSTPPIVVADRCTLFGMALGVACMLQPWWELGFRVGFFATLACTIAQIVTSHLLPKDGA